MSEFNGDTAVMENEVETVENQEVDDQEVFGDESTGEVAMAGIAESSPYDKSLDEQFENIASSNGDGTSLLGSAEEDTEPAQVYSLDDVLQGESKTAIVNFNDIAIQPGFNVRDLDTPEALAHIQWLYNNAFVDGNGWRDAWRGYFDPSTGKINLTAGHCRYAATQMWVDGGNAAPPIKIDLEEKDASEEDYVATLLLENSGKPLEPIEKARAFKRLKDLGWEDTRIAYQSSPAITAAQVSNYLLLEQAGNNKKVLKALKGDKIEATTVMQLARKCKNKEGQVNLEKLEGLVVGAIEVAEGAGRKKATGAIAEQVRAVREQSGEDGDDQGTLPGTDGETEPKPVVVTPKLKKGEAALLLLFRDTMKDVFWNLGKPKSAKGKTIKLTVSEDTITMARDDFDRLADYMTDLMDSQDSE